jgi:hypothetical protein
MPSELQVDKAIALIQKVGGNYKYFFEKLSSPTWIEPLAKRGRFNRPPGSRASFCNRVSPAGVARGKISASDGSYRTRSSRTGDRPTLLRERQSAGAFTAYRDREPPFRIGSA